MVAVAGCTNNQRSSTEFPHNPINFSASHMSIVLVAATAESTCSVAQTSLLHFYRAGGLLGQTEKKWVGDFRLNADIFKSDSSARHTVVQAFQLDPGDYKLELHVLPYGGRPNGLPFAMAGIRLSAGEVRYIGNLETYGCGDTTQTKLSTDWSNLNSVFSRVYPDLPSNDVRVSAVPF